MAFRLRFLAGRRAFEIIRANGLDPETVRVIPGAAGGPKFLVLAGLDRFIFGQWLKHVYKPVFLIGASIGAWRFAAAAQHDPETALGRFVNAYIRQRYEADPTPGDVSRESRRVLDRYLADGGRREILSHPHFRLNLLAVRCRGPAGGKSPYVQGAGLAVAAAANILNRRLLGMFFERALFYDPRDRPPFFGMDQLPIRRIALASANIHPAILASGSIPMVMSGVDRIPGAPQGVYRDGGVLDYHLDLPFLNREDGLVLYPHYTDRVIPGWMDKRLKWRKPSVKHMDRVLLVAPSRSFVDSLPLKKIPDRTDFYRFKGRDAGRMAYWQTVADRSLDLANEFADAVSGGGIRARVEPMDVTDPNR